MRKHAVIVVKGTKALPKVFILNTPDFGEPDFYRQTTSLNAFFYSTKGRNVSPDGVLYNCELWSDFESRQESLRKHGMEYEVTETFDSIWDFYKFIGYDYRRKKYGRKGDG